MDMVDSISDSSSNRLDILSNCESKVLRILSITQDTLQELQNLPNCDTHKLDEFSGSYLDAILYIQTNLKDIDMPNWTDSLEVTPKPSGKSDTVNYPDNDNIIVMKKIDVMKAVYTMNEDQANE